MGANISTSSGSEGSTVKLSCPKGHIMEGSKIKYGKLDNNTLSKNYNLPKKCINKKNCSFKINNDTVKNDPAPGAEKKFEVTLACFDPPYIPGLKAVLKKNLRGKNHWIKKQKKKLLKTVNINGETKVVQVEMEQQQIKPIVILPPPIKVKRKYSISSIFTNKYLLVAIIAIVVLWFLIMRNHRKIQEVLKKQ